MALAELGSPKADPAWAPTLKEMRESFKQMLGAGARAAVGDGGGPIHPALLVQEVRARLPREAAIVLDGGGIAAKLAQPEHPVVVITGDGSFGLLAELREGGGGLHQCADRPVGRLPRDDGHVSDNVIACGWAPSSCAGSPRNPVRVS